MNAGEWIAKFLIEKGVTDVFGIPGVVVMDFLYAIDKRKPEITPHLCYHEQGGAFEACGYAQATGKLGVAYSTRGPGLTNMITAIADAYYDSIPCMFFTSHSTLDLVPGMRVMNNQEIDTVALTAPITKYAVRIDKVDDLQREITKAYHMATFGRKGPVFVDIFSGIFGKDVVEEIAEEDFCDDDFAEVVSTAVLDIECRIAKSKRPIILIGNGVRYSENSIIHEVAKKYQIPVLSSRSSQDILANSEMYFGFVGSRATRYSNFIMSKTDLIISVGNRLAFPVNSKSFKTIVENATTIRIDIDRNEFLRPVPNSIEYCLDINAFLPKFKQADLFYEGSEEWIGACKTLKTKLNCWDKIPVIDAIMNIISSMEESAPIVCDVGNHSFWVTSALAYLNRSNRIMYSASFGTLGCALPKAIGAHYSTKKPVICFSGDQGIQMNIQELQYVASNNLPIVIVILNNSSSGMIMEREIAKYGDYLVHTTLDSGYSFPDFEKLANVFDLDYVKVEPDKLQKQADFSYDNRPVLVEVVVDRDTELAPSLPVGNACQDLAPSIPIDLYNELNSL